MFTLRIMSIDDYDAVIDVLHTTAGISLRDTDSLEATSRYLERNPGLSFIAEIEQEIVGCVMCGHDGRRGYLQHLAVRPQARRQGIAQALVEKCLAELGQLGIYKCHIDVLKSNEAGAEYWRGQGWQLRTDIDRYSLVSNDSPNA